MGRAGVVDRSRGDGVIQMCQILVSMGTDRLRELAQVLQLAL